VLVAEKSATKYLNKVHKLIFVHTDGLPFNKMDTSYELYDTVGLPFLGVRPLASLTNPSDAIFTT